MNMINDENLDEETKKALKKMIWQDRLENAAITVGILLLVALILYVIYWFFHDCIGIEINGFGEVVLFFIVFFFVIISRFLR